MPTYQYACTECGERLEVVQSFTDAALTVCPNCAGKLRKVFNSVGVVFKGSGFYRNDSRTASPNGATGTDKSPDATSSDSSKSDTPAATTSSSSKSDTSSSSSSSSSGSTTTKAAAATA